MWKRAKAGCNSRRYGFVGNHCKPDMFRWRVDWMIGEEYRSLGQTVGVLHKEGVYVRKQAIHNHIHAGSEGGSRSATHRTALKYAAG